ncbi:lipopolysaccharide biosynthesis protein [Leisingera sp. D0M16]|uniref:lipopolysaccharide biosynthesis protein n=1 Tax=Leisingera coralii TaxID=3351347 RepID=UPI003B7C9AB6
MTTHNQGARVPESQETLIRRNLARSRIIVMVAFAANAGLNLALLGILAKWGGLNLVGAWSFLNAVLLLVMLAEFGITNALTYRIGRDGLEAAAPVLRLLLHLLAALAILFAAGAYWLAPDWGLALALTVLAGMLQLGSDWLIAIRMGHHEQYWFNVKTVLRVVLQTAAALGFYHAAPDHAPTAFALALLVSRGAEFLLSRFMTRREFALRGPRAELAQISKLTKGFGLLSVAQRGLDPLSRLLIAALAGAEALGVFTIAWRVSAVVNQSVSEALRVLLPGLAAMRTAEDQDRVCRLMRDSVAGQLVLVGAAMLAIAIHADLLFRTWLGQSDETLVAVLRIFLIGGAGAAVTTPFFWASQAFGQVTPMARLNLLQVAATLGLGAAVLWDAPEISGFVTVYALSQGLAGLVPVYLVNRAGGLAWRVAAGLPLAVITGYLAAVTALNLALTHLPFDTAPVYLLLTVLACNLVTTAPAGLLILRRLKAAAP